MASALAPFPLANGIISLAFAAAVLARCLRRSNPALLAWGVGLVIFAVASFLQFSDELGGWTDLSYKVYYAVAQVNVGVLALGSVLLLSRRWGLYFLAYLVLLTLAFAYALAVATVDLGAANAGGSALGSQPVRYFSFPYTIPGTTLLIGIALYSWWRTRLNYNLLIAGGFILAAVAGTSARLGLDLPALLYIFTLAGVILLFLGFMWSRPAGQPRGRPGAAAT